MASSSHEQKQNFVRASIAIGVTIGVSIFTAGIYMLPPGKETDFPSDLEKLVYTLKWQSLSVMMLLFGIERVGNVRFSTTAIDPMRGNSENLLFVEARYLQNTLEQLVVSLTGQLILSLYVSAAFLPRVIPTLVVLFVTGRILFYVGYKMDPMKRGVGFSMTVIPSVIVHVYCLFCFFWYK